MTNDPTDSNDEVTPSAHDHTCHLCGRPGDEVRNLTYPLGGTSGRTLGRLCNNCAGVLAYLIHGEDPWAIILPDHGDPAISGDRLTRIRSRLRELEAGVVE